MYLLVDELSPRYIQKQLIFTPLNSPKYVHSIQPMNILGIDQSFTSTGLILLNNEKIVDSWLVKSDHTQDIFTRASYIADNIRDKVLDNNIDKIGIEGLAFGGIGNATRDLSGLQFIIIDRLRHETNIDKNIIIISPLTIKKYATNKKGKIEKKDMYESLPQEIKNFFQERGYKKTKGLYDLTDAYWIAMYISNM